MEAALKQKIYAYIDSQGFNGGAYRDFILSVEIEDGHLVSDSNSNHSFYPDLPFDLTHEEQLQVIEEYIFDLTGKNVNLNKINDYFHANGVPFIVPINEHGERGYSVAFKKIPGSLFIRGSYGINTLGQIEMIEGDLGLSDCNMQSLGNLTRVNGSLWTAQGATQFTLLKTLSPLIEVQGDCNLKMLPLQTLGTLKRVGGNLNLRNTFIESLGELEYVGGNVLLSRHLDLDFSKVKVEGKIKRYNDIAFTTSDIV
jgi:hypothetical protein